MSITITHTYADGTLLDGTSREQGRRGEPVRAVLDRHGWRWGRTIGCWYQRNSRDRPADPGRIEATARELRSLGLEVTVEVDNTPRDMAAAEADRAERMEDRAAALQAKASRRANAAAAREAAASRVLDGIPMGQPLLVDHYSYRADRNRRERAFSNLDKALKLSREADHHAERAATAARHMDHRYNPVTVANRIVDLEAKLRRRSLNEEYRAKYENELAYWRGVREQQIAAGEVVEYGPHNVAVDGWVKGWAGSGWFRVVRVNKTTVTLATTRSAIDETKWLTNTLPYHRITGYRAPEEVEAR
ncbi:DUF3560 domain-containing protein [Amycolatopsis thermophila]|uniref:DUF3560 domain-containing protein n=1 Tax=Amycolatopsis thermophila TaxID=206084 RepID=A0ABU0EMT2_9PSEU|nr:DUF3560 domain-containing protein [Amycolatopsis thermophila]MDQ0376586.1 hypothetical protein [Amycolatopsis thermophila]